MSDLGVLVPILTPTEFSTRRTAASNTAAGGELAVARAAPSDERAAAPEIRFGTPLTGLTVTGLTAGLVAVLQEAQDRREDAGTAASDISEGEDAAGDTETAVEDGQEGGAAAVSGQQGSAGPGNLTPEQQQVVQELQRIDAEVRRHEQAHAAAGGPYAGAPSYDYERGPDGRLYAVGGDVQIDVAPIPGNPAATIQKLRTVRRAALAPATPSPQDQRVAAIAQQRITEAQRELTELQREERQEAAAEREEAQARAEGLQPGISGIAAGGDDAGAGNTARRQPGGAGSAPSGAGAVFDIIA